MTKQEEINTRSDFKFGDYDFTPIYDTLKNYFPIEDSSLYNEKNISEYPGAIKISAILNDQFFNKKNYTQRWATFKKHLKKQLKRPVEETMVAFYPCYSGYITIYKQKTLNHTYTKELHFYISLLGPYYTIFGIDKSEITLNENWTSFDDQIKEREVNYAADHVITVSPYQEYAEEFKSLQTHITEYFKELRFVPFDINLKKIAGVSLFYPDMKGDLEDSVFSALFKPEEITTSLRGDSRFGYEEWSTIIRLNTTQVEEVRKQLLLKASANKEELTVHKVWKLKNAIAIPRPTGEVNVLFGMDPIEIIDLSDPHFLFIYTSENREPSRCNYAIAENEIQLTDPLQQLRFKIKALNNHELNLILSIDRGTQDHNSYFGNLVEMTYETYQ